MRFYKQDKMLKFMEKKSNEPKSKQKRIFTQLGSSDSTIKRYRDDIIMDNPYERNNNRKKNNKSNSSITQTHTTIENTKGNKNSKNKKRTI